MLETPHVRRVLIIEDNEEAATALANLLAAAGYEVETVCDGDSALVAADAFHPEICLIDVNVPQLSCDELARELRERLEHPPLLANVTPFDERDDWDANAEFDLDFTKPSDPFEVVAQLSVFLKSDRPKVRRKVHDSYYGNLRMPSLRFS